MKFTILTNSQRFVLKRNLIFASFLLLTACYHPLEIQGRGDIVSSTGQNNCSLEEQPCENLITGDYYVTYRAAPREGWRFDSWEGCGDQFPECALNVPAQVVREFWGQTMIPLVAVFEPSAEPSAERTPSPLTVKQIHSGHSLTDVAAFKGNWPGHLQAMINQLQPNAAQIGKSTLPGSPMSWRWANAPGYGSPDARQDISNWELLIITESVPLFEEPYKQEHRDWLRTWAEHAWTYGNGGDGAPTLLYSIWTNIDDRDGDFRTLLSQYEADWEAMADYASANLPPEASVYIIPGHRLMIRLYDDIEAGAVPGISNISGFFEDTIHSNGLGSYALALLHLAVVHHVDPRGLPYTGYGLDPEPSPALAGYLQDAVWDVVNGYSRAGMGPAQHTSQVTAGQ